MANKRRKRRRGGGVSAQETRIQLDRFTESDLRTWKRMAEGVEEFHVRQYFHLESLRRLHQEALLDALRATTSTSINIDQWVRIVDYKYSLEPLSAIGSLFLGGRFNIGRDLNPGQFPPYPALYIAENHKTAYAEKFGMAESTKRDGLSGHELALRTPGSYTLVNISGVLGNLFSVERAVNFNKFLAVIKKFKMPNELKDLAREVGIKQPWIINKTSMLKQSMLVDDWRGWPAQFQLPANPQIIGRMIKDAGFEGVLYPSTKGKGKCVAVFPENIDGTDSYLELVDEPPAGAKCTRLDSQNWQELING